LNTVAAIVPETGSPHAMSRCRRLASELGLDLGGPEVADNAPALMVGQRLRVRFPGEDTRKEELMADWSRLDVRSKAGRDRRQPLVRAVQGRTRYKGLPLVLDGTAGLGEDAWLLSCLGHCVLAVERHPAVFALLRDAWACAAVFSPWRARRIRPVWGDTRSLLQNMIGQAGPQDSPGPGRRCLPRPDVVYLDPMFPGHEQRKTAERKPLRLLRSVVGQQVEDPGMLKLALAAARDRVVVKRPLKAPFFARSECAPVHQVFGRRVRFDVYPNTIQFCQRQN